MKKGSVFGSRRSMGNDVHTHLTPSITRKFGNPGYPIPEENGLSPHEKEARILQLTSAAKQLLKLGLNEPAFESLMKAYLIDPMSPHVIACEKTVLPTWELMQKHSSSSPQPVSDEERLKLLKAQKEAQRIEHERAKWEQAASKSKILGNQEIIPPTKRGGIS